MKTVVKKWLRDKECGYLDNGSGSDIAVRKADLIKCQYLKVGMTVEFECHIEKNGLVARKVSISDQNKSKSTNNKGNKGNNNKAHYFGVMT